MDQSFDNSVTQTPTEAFPCPYCGQMLGPGCRVCVSCRKPIDPFEIRVLAPAVEPAPGEQTPPPPERVRFPWNLFLILLIARFIAAVAVSQALGPAQAAGAANQEQALIRTILIMGSIEFICGVWVFYDARQRGIAKPLRWGLASAVFWIVFFPWYLSRRKNPRAVCPFVEAEAGPVARALFFALVVFFLLSIIVGIFKGPAPG